MTREPCLCRVIGCHHYTRRLEPEDKWLCAEHWRLVPKWMKRRRTKLVQLWKKHGGTNDMPWGDVSPRARRALSLYWRWWNKIESLAIERAMGITA